MNPSSTTYCASPLGPLRITGDNAGVSAITCLDALPAVSGNDQPITPLPEPVAQAVRQLTEYFAGTRQTFDFSVNPAGTPFQQGVWRVLLTVPFGTTLSYLSLTRRIGDEKAIRAVAQANGRNPLAIVVPCHRIIGANGSLTGYAGGLWRKQWLLQHEGARPGERTGQMLLFGLP